LSGKKAKAGRRAATVPQVRSKGQPAKGSSQSWADPKRLFWPAVVVVAIGLLAFVALRNNNTSSGAKASQGGGSYPYAVGSPARGASAPAVNLPATSGGTFNLAAYKGKTQVLLYFQEGLTCQPCWDQIAAIQKDRAKFNAVGIGPIVSITTDPLNLIKQKASDDGLTIPVLSDQGGQVSDSYNARNFGMMGHDRDGHTFVLIGKDGRIRWRADYGGAPKYTMFVPDNVLLDQLKKGVQG